MLLIVLIKETAQGKSLEQTAMQMKALDLNIKYQQQCYKYHNESRGGQK